MKQRFKELFIEKDSVKVADLISFTRLLKKEAGEDFSFVDTIDEFKPTAMTYEGKTSEEVLNMIYNDWDKLSKVDLYHSILYCIMHITKDDWFVSSAIACLAKS